MLLLSLFVGLLAAAYLLHQRSRHKRHLPPGPAGYPIISNLLDWPFEAGWLTFTSWREKFGQYASDSPLTVVADRAFSGDIIHLEIFGMHLVILNSMEAAQTLLGQVIYSDRPPLAMAGDL